MIITHEINWNQCLSKIIFPAIKKGWKPDVPTHFFWGWAKLTDRKLLKEIEAKGEDWWFIDIGYITADIVRYPAPSILNKDDTYFRICHKSFHSVISSYNSTLERRKILENKGLLKEIPKQNLDNKYILVCPSSPTVTQIMHGITPDKWIVKQKQKFKNEEIVIRHKPRPGNKWWGTNINNWLKDSKLLITDMSLSSVDAVLQGVPVYCTSQNVAHPISIEGDSSKTDSWITEIANHQFNIEEIESGEAYEVLNGV